MKKKRSPVYDTVTGENIREAYEEMDVQKANSVRDIISQLIAVFVGIAVYTVICITSVFGYVVGDCKSVLKNTPPLSDLWRLLSDLTERITFGYSIGFLRWPLHWILMLIALILVTPIIYNLLSRLLPRKIRQTPIPEDSIEQAKTLAKMDFYRLEKIRDVLIGVIITLFSLSIAAATLYFSVAEQMVVEPSEPLTVGGLGFALFIGGANGLLLAYACIYIVIFLCKDSMGYLYTIQKNADSYWPKIDPEEEKRREAKRFAEHAKWERLMQHTAYYERSFNDAYYRGTSYEGGTPSYTTTVSGDTVSYPDFGNDKEALMRYLNGNDAPSSKTAAVKAFNDANLTNVQYDPNTNSVR